MTLYKTCSTRTPLASTRPLGLRSNTLFTSNPTAVTSHFHPLDSSAVEAGVREVRPGLVHWSQLVERSYCGGHCPRTAPVGGSLGSSCGAAPPRPPRESRHTAGTSDQERLFHNLRCTPLLVFFLPTIYLIGAPEEGEQYLLLFSLGHTATHGQRKKLFYNLCGYMQLCIFLSHY